MKRIFSVLLFSMLIISMCLPPAWARDELTNREPLPKRVIQRAIATVMRTPVLPHRLRAREWGGSVAKAKERLRKKAESNVPEEIREKAAKIARDADQGKKPKNGNSVASELMGSWKTVPIILMATIAQIYREQQSERNLENQAMFGNPFDDFSELVEIDHLWPFEGRIMDVPLGPDGEFVLGRSKEPWWSYEEAPKGTARIKILALGELAEVVRLQKANGEVVPLEGLDSIVRVLTNPAAPEETEEDPKEPEIKADIEPEDDFATLEEPARFDYFAEADEEKTAKEKESPNPCDFQAYQGRCIKVFNPTPGHEMQVALGRLVNFDLFHSMILAGGANLGFRIPWVRGKFQALEKSLQKRTPKAWMASYLAGGVHMLITFPFWEAGGFLTQMAQELIENERDFERSKNLFTRFLFSDVRRVGWRKLAALMDPSTEVPGVDARLAREIREDLRVMGLLFENMFLILTSNQGLQMRLLRGIVRERVWTMDFVLTVGFLASAGIIEKNAPGAIRSGAVRVGSYAWHRMENASLRSIQNLAKTAAQRKQLFVKVMARVGQKSGVQMAKRFGVRMAASQAGKWVGSRAMGLVSLGWLGVVFTMILTVVEMFPAEHKLLVDGTFKDLVADGFSRWAGKKRNSLRKLLAEARPDVTKVMQKLTDISRAREIAFNQINFNRNAALELIQANEYKISLIVQGLGEYEGYGEIPLFRRSQIWDLHNQIEPIRQDLVRIYDPELIKLYEDEMVFLAEVFGLTQDEFSQYATAYRVVNYDEMESHLRVAAEKARFGAAAEPMVRYASGTTMLRNHWVTQLRGSPEEEWGWRVLEQVEKRKEMAKLSPRKRSKQPWKNPLRQYIEVNPIDVLMAGNEEYYRMQRDQRAAEEGERRWVKTFGLNEWESIHDLVETMREDENQTLALFPATNTEEGEKQWAELFRTAPDPKAMKDYAFAVRINIDQLWDPSPPPQL